ARRRYRGGAGYRRRGPEAALSSGSIYGLMGFSSAPTAQERQRVQEPAYVRISVNAALPEGTDGNRPVPDDDHTMDVVDVVRFADEFARSHSTHRALLLAGGLHA